MRIAGVRVESLLDGDGVNLVVFFQGCTIKCKGCHNISLQSPLGGKDLSVKDILSYVTPITTGIVLSGGEPTEQLADALILAKVARTMGLHTTLFTGHTADYLSNNAEKYSDILTTFDTIKFGPYVEELRTTTSGPMGSTNQYMVNTLDLINKESKGD